MVPLENVYEFRGGNMVSSILQASFDEPFWVDPYHPQFPFGWSSCIHIFFFTTTRSRNSKNLTFIHLLNKNGCVCWKGQNWLEGIPPKVYFVFVQEKVWLRITLDSKKDGFNFQSKYFIPKNLWLQPSKRPNPEIHWYNLISIYNLGYFVYFNLLYQDATVLAPSSELPSHQCHWQSPPRNPKEGSMDWPQNSKDLGWILLPTWSTWSRWPSLMLQSALRSENHVLLGQLDIGDHKFKEILGGLR